MVDARLITFLTLLEEKNYTNTAKKLYITQPAVTHHIKSLEKEFDIELFKNSKSFELTHAGAILKEYAEFAVNQYSQFQTALNRQMDRKIYNIAFTITSFPCLSSISIFKKISEDNIGFNFYIYDYDTIQKGLMDGSIDFAFIDNSFDSAKFESISIKFEKICIVCDALGSHAGLKRITREQLSTTPIILLNDTNGVTKAVNQALTLKNIRLKKNMILYTNQIESMIELIKLYDGLAFMYESSAIKYENDKLIKRLDMLNFQVTQNIYILYSRQSFLDSTTLSIIETTKSWTIA